MTHAITSPTAMCHCHDVRPGILYQYLTHQGVPGKKACCPEHVSNASPCISVLMQTCIVLPHHQLRPGYAGMLYYIKNADPALGCSPQSKLEARLPAKSATERLEAEGMAEPVLVLLVHPQAWQLT